MNIIRKPEPRRLPRFRFGDNAGKLSPVAVPGMYPLQYYCADTGTGRVYWEPVCADCGSEGQARKRGEIPVACDVHWEGPDNRCGHCGDKIPSAYGNPN